MLLGHADVVITAKVYTHLLDGDLKVRDEFHLDPSSKKANSSPIDAQLSKLGLKDPMTAALSQLLKVLQERGPQEDPAALGRAVGHALTSLDNPSHVPTTTAPEPSFATPVLQDASSSRNEKGPSPKTMAAFSNSSTGLASLFSGGPERIRTSDLRIRSATL